MRGELLFGLVLMLCANARESVTAARAPIRGYGADRLEWASHCILDRLLFILHCHSFGMHDAWSFCSQQMPQYDVIAITLSDNPHLRYLPSEEQLLRSFPNLVVVSVENCPHFSCYRLKTGNFTKLTILHDCNLHGDERSLETDLLRLPDDSFFCHDYCQLLWWVNELMDKHSIRLRAFLGERLAEMNTVSYGLSYRIGRLGTSSRRLRFVSGFSWVICTAEDEQTEQKRRHEEREAKIEVIFDEEKQPWFKNYNKKQHDDIFKHRNTVARMSHNLGYADCVYRTARTMAGNASPNRVFADP